LTNTFFFNRTTLPGTWHEDLSIFVLLTAVSFLFKTTFCLDFIRILNIKKTRYVTVFSRVAHCMAFMLIYCTYR